MCDLLRKHWGWALPLVLTACSGSVGGDASPGPSAGGKADDTTDFPPDDPVADDEARDGACTLVLVAASRSAGELRAEVLFDPDHGSPALLLQGPEAMVRRAQAAEVEPAFGRLLRATFVAKVDDAPIELWPFLDTPTGRLFAATSQDAGYSLASDGELVLEPPATCAWDPMVELRDSQTERDAQEMPDGGWYVTPLHAVLTAEGEVVVTGWGRAGFSECERGVESRRHGLTFVVDPDDLQRGSASTLEIEPIDERPQEAGDVLYCAGHAPLMDGRIFYAGGAGYVGLGEAAEYEYGLDYARIFDPQTRSFERVGEAMPGGPDLPLPGDPTAALGSSGRRWYPSVTRLPDGTMMVVGGMTTCCPTPELNLSIDLFDPETGGWTTSVHHAVGLEAAGIGIRDYPHPFVLPAPIDVGDASAQVALVGNKAEVTLLDVRPGLDERERIVVRPNAQRPNVASDPNVGEESTALMIPTLGEDAGRAEIVIIGGGKDDGSANARADIYDPYADQWRSIDLGIGRYTGSAVLLPTGDILISGGWGGAGDWRRVQILDPYTGALQTFDPWLEDDTQRGYHNVALPLSDGRVLIGGGVDPAHDIGCEKPQLRLFNPPYLLKTARPAFVGDPPKSLQLGGEAYTLQVETTLADARGLMLVAPGAFTHSFDHNARVVPLAYRQTGDRVELRSPSNAWIAPPGEYFLVAVDEHGVPSEGWPLLVHP